MSKRFLCFFGSAFAGAILLCSTEVLQADVIYSDFGPGNSSITGTGQPAKGSNYGYTSSAFSFTATESATVSKIDIALVDLIGTNSAFVSLASDAAGTPGAVLGTGSLVGVPASGTSNPYETVTGTFVGAHLIAGNQYWVEVAPGANDSYIFWQQDVSPTLVSSLGRDTIGTGIYANVGHVAPGAFDVMGTATAPEPTTLALGASGLFLVAGLVRRRRSK